MERGPVSSEEINKIAKQLLKNPGKPSWMLDSTYTMITTGITPVTAEAERDIIPVMEAQTEHTSSGSDTFDTVITKIVEINQEKDPQATIAHVRNLNPEHSPFLVETIANPRTVVAQQSVDLAIAQQIVEGKITSETDVPTLVRNIFAEKEKEAQEIKTFREAFGELRGKMTPDYLRGIKERIDFAKDFNLKFNQLKEDYKQTFGSELSIPQDHAIGDIMVLLSLRKPAEARKRFFEDRLKKDQFLRNAPGDFVIDGHTGDKYFAQLYQRGKPQELDTGELLYNRQTKAEQTAWVLHSMATTWRSREQFGITGKNNTINTVIFHKHGEDVYPLQLQIDSMNLPTIEALTDALKFLDSDTPPEGVPALSKAVRIRLHNEAHEPTPLDKKSALFRKIANSSDIILQTGSDMNITREDRWIKREAPESLYFNFSHATFNVNLNFLTAHDNGSILTGVTVKNFHPDINGMPARKFLRQTMIRTYQWAIHPPTDTTVTSPIGIQVKPLLKEGDIPESSLSEQQRNILAALPNELYGFGKLDHQTFLDTLDTMALLNRNNVPVSIPRLLPMALMLSARPENAATHFIVDSTHKDRKGLDVAIATLLTPSQRTKLYEHFVNYKGRSETERQSYFSEYQDELVPIADQLQKNIQLFREDIKWAQTGESTTATFASVAGRLESILSGTANLIKHDVSDVLNAPGGMVSCMADLDKDGIQSDKKGKEDQRLLGISEPLPIADIWKETYVGTARAAVYEHIGRHAGVMGAGISFQEDFNLNHLPEFTYTDRLTWGHLHYELIEHIQKSYNIDTMALTAFIRATDHRSQNGKELLKLIETTPLFTERTTIGVQGKIVPPEKTIEILMNAQKSIIHTRMENIPVAVEFLSGVLTPAA